MLDRLRKLLVPDVDLSAKIAVVTLFIGKHLEDVGHRLVDLEARQLQRGEKGDKGERGERGAEGKPGRDGAVGPAGLAGEIGPAGKEGKAGAKGKDGVSVVDADIDLDGHLVLKLSNGKIVDAGDIPAAPQTQSGVFVSGNAWQVTVDTVAPSNPEINQLWLDIS